MNSMEQMALPVRLKSAQTFETFVSGPNHALIKSVIRRCEQGSLPMFWLWSVGGAGRSHLLQALCHRSSSYGRSCVYLPLTESSFHPAMLEGMESLSMVCVDDIDAVFPEPEWEHALFKLHLGLHERGGNLVVSAAAPPSGLNIALKDLASRFQAAEIWQLHPLKDAEQMQALKLRATQLGLSISEEVQSYLLRHAPRDLALLCELLDEIDTQALVKQQGITVPLVRILLKNQL
jgi:DnaA family protein